VRGVITMAMQDALASMRAHGKLEYRPGLKVWTVWNEPPVPGWFVSDLTIRALLARGLAERVGRSGLQLTTQGRVEAHAQAVQR
jgi:hypothetical protein